MRKLLIPAFAALLAGIALVWAQPPAGAWLIQGSTTSPAAITLGCSAHVASGTTGAVDCTGVTLFVAAANSIVTTPTVADSSGNTWTQSCGPTPASTSTGCFWYVYAPTVSASQTFTVGGSAFSSLQVISFKNTVGSTVDQVSGQTLTSGATCQTGTSITPSAAGEVVISTLMINGDSTVATIDSGTILGQDPYAGGVNFGGAIAYTIQTSAVAYQPTWTAGGSSSSNNCIAASFK